MAFLGQVPLHWLIQPDMTSQLLHLQDLPVRKVFDALGMTWREQGTSHPGGKDIEPCVVACPEEAEATDSSLAGSTHVLPVCKEAEPETANVLGRDEQAVLRKGTYDFARYGNSCCLMMPVAD